MDSRRIFPCLGTPWQHVEVYIHKLHGSVCFLNVFFGTKSFRFLQKAENIPQFKWWLNGDESHKVPLDPKMMNPMKVLGPPNI